MKRKQIFVGYRFVFIDQEKQKQLFLKRGENYHQVVLNNARKNKN